VYKARLSLGSTELQAGLQPVACWALRNALAAGIVSFTEIYWKPISNRLAMGVK
jgi:hypothetical protein